MSATSSGRVVDVVATSYASCVWKNIDRDTGGGSMADASTSSRRAPRARGAVKASTRASVDASRACTPSAAARRVTRSIVLARARGSRRLRRESDSGRWSDFTLGNLLNRGPRRWGCKPDRSCFCSSSPWTRADERAVETRFACAP